MDTQSKTKILERIIVALDYPSPAGAKTLLTELEGLPCYFKVGMQLFYAAGPQFIFMLKESGHKVFLDLKLHDIPNTVKGAAESITRLGVDMFNVHAAGGSRMMEYALEGVEEAVSRRIGLKRPIILGVTQLTSTDKRTLNEEIGISGSIEDAVIHYAELAKGSGLDGVVASALEVPLIKRVCGEAFLTVTPGIRPEGAAVSDQSRVMTPKMAFANGSDYIVVGRPITSAESPRIALESIVEELSS